MERCGRHCYLGLPSREMINLSSGFRHASQEDRIVFNLTSDMYNENTGQVPYQIIHQNSVQDNPIK